MWRLCVGHMVVCTYKWDRFLACNARCYTTRSTTAIVASFTFIWPGVPMISVSFWCSPPYRRPHCAFVHLVWACNNNNNNQDNVYGAVIMAEPLREFTRFIWWMARPIWRDPDDVSHCRILPPDKTEWWLISATLCGWGRCFMADQLW